MPTLPYTSEEIEALFGGAHPADTRETLRERLSRLPDVARGVYLRENISDPDTPLLDVVNTVLYAFDARNRARVATGLGMTEDALVTLLVGVVLGVEWRTEC